MKDQGANHLSVEDSFHRLLWVLRTPPYANASCFWGSTATAAVAGLAFWALAAHLHDAKVVGAGAAAPSILTLLATFSHLGLRLGLIRFYRSHTAGARTLSRLYRWFKVKLLWRYGGRSVSWSGP